MEGLRDAPEMPEIELVYLIDFMNQLGYATSGFNGATRISWQELKAWKDTTGTSLTAWEAETLMTLSRAYVEQLNASHEPSCPSPLDDVLDKDKRKEVETKIRSAFNSLKGMK
jgi:hypothetical protein